MGLAERSWFSGGGSNVNVLQQHTQKHSNHLTDEVMILKDLNVSREKKSNV